MKVILLLFSFFSFVTMAQSTQFEMQGSYSHPKAKKPIDFTLKWTESRDDIKGSYSDNFITSSKEITGAKGDDSRIFRVSLDKNPKGIGAITIVTSDHATMSKDKKIPVSIVTQDGSGNPLASTQTKVSLLAMTVPQRQEEGRCQEGFGQLAGFCGLYEGIISEEEDTGGFCNLAEGPVPVLQMTTDGSIILHIGQVSDVVVTPQHQIGRLPTDPATNGIDVMSRECRPLAGTTFKGDHCKRINLSGTFTQDDEDKRFRGTYSITNEITQQRCSYNLTMDLRN